jgi:hypothetical protein
MLRWESVAPLGLPVVPEVNCTFTGSWHEASASAAASRSGDTSSAAARKASQETAPGGVSPRSDTTFRSRGNAALPMPSGPAAASSGTTSARMAW